MAFKFRHEVQRSRDRASMIGLGSLLVALMCASIANLYYQRAFDARAWPTNGIFDQVVVTAVGDIFVKVKDPILGRSDRVQRYNCQGEFKAAFQPNNVSGLFKFAVNSDETLSIYNVRTDSIDVFTLDGEYIQRRDLNSRQMPFDFLKSGPSVLQVELCAFVKDSVSGNFAAKNGAGTWPLERGDWLLEYVLSRQNIWGIAILGGLLIVFSILRKIKLNPA